MLRKSILPILFLFIGLYVNAQTYRTQALVPDIRTIQVIANGDWMQPPVIKLNSDDYINISFDRLSKTSSTRLRYKLVHCDADWKQSRLSDIEYIDGFNDNLIEDYAESINTNVEYTNFQIEIPNRDISIKESGNYALVVYDEDKPNEALLYASFSVLDSQIAISGQVSTNTDIDANKEHQQVSFQISYPGLTVRDPFTDLKVFVMQNNRLDNMRSFIKPTYIQPNKLIYEHNRDLIFEAGNEYRRFEIVSYRYNGLNVESVQYVRPYYQAYIVPQKLRSGKVYSYDQDQNGRFLIRNAEANDSDIEGDYFIVNFRLEMDEPILESIYLNGDFSNNSFTEDYLMKYDHSEKVYYTSLLLKQGAYNYQYLTRKGKGIYSPALIEGNYFETENEYLIYVYHRPMGQQFDSFIGLLRINKK